MRTATGKLGLLLSVMLLRVGSSVYHPVGISWLSRTYQGEGADRALGMSRRDWLKAAAATPALGAFYFGYKEMNAKPVKAAEAAPQPALATAVMLTGPSSRFGLQ